MTLMAWRLSKLYEDGKMSHAMASNVKVPNLYCAVPTLHQDQSGICSSSWHQLMAPTETQHLPKACMQRSELSKLSAGIQCCVDLAP